jgi:hypothetical protein
MCSDSGLTTLSNATIAPLKDFVCIPAVTSTVPFQPREPALQLFLGNNALTRVPGAIFDLRNLTLLSLRSNGLQELPSGIGKLANLETLNVSANQLRWLPSQLLDLVRPETGKLRNLLVHPNPFEPIETLGIEDVPSAVDGVTRSTVQYNDNLGQPLSDSASTCRLSSSAAAQPSDGASKVRSLVELTLKACTRSPYLSQLGDMLSDGPPVLSDALNIVNLQQESGGSSCSICRRDLVVVRTQWLEWHLMGDATGLLPPYLYRGCSWKCVPESAKSAESV